jgi:CHAD domain-containing protein
VVAGTGPAVDSTIIGAGRFVLTIMPRLRARHELLRKRVDRFTRLLRGVQSGDVHAIHQLRVASRRLRELLPVLQLDPDESRKLGRRLRRVTRELGPVRELDVLLGLVHEFGQAGSRRRALELVAARVHAERSGAGAELRHELPIPDLERIARRLERATRALEKSERRGNGERDRAWRWAIDARLARRAGALADAIRAAGAVYLPERLHTVRIALKKLRYAVELRDERAGGRRGAEQLPLRRTQELLGRLHDLQVLLDRVRQVQASLSASDVALWRDFDRTVASLEDDCRRLHARYMRSRTAILAICDRLASAADAATAAGERRTRAG